jgi:hypothetical protein
VLILESDDIALSTANEIAEAVVAELSARNDAPAYIVIAETEMFPELVLWIVKRNDAIFPRIEWEPHYIDASEMVFDNVEARDST